MKLYSWGANSHGQLGQNLVSEACNLPVEVDSSSFLPASLTSIVGGGGHTLALDSSGRIYSCGWNNSGQLGLPITKALSFQLVESLGSQSAAQLACGWDSSLAVSCDGGLLVWGSNKFGQLGLPHQKVSKLESPSTVSISRVKQAALGLRHLVLVTDDGKVFVSGCGSKGQLGILKSDGLPMPEVQTLTQVPSLQNIIRVSCGQHHSLALSHTGKVYVWGDNRFGQLGLNSSVQSVVYTPQELPLSLTSELKGSPSSVVAGWTHSVLVTDMGEIVNWGRNTYSQLGRESAATWNPSILKLSERILHIVVGSEHNLVLTDTGHVLSWGWNEHGNCGTGNQENVTTPSLIHMNGRGKAVIIGTGACHSFVVVDSEGTKNSE